MQPDLPLKSTQPHRKWIPYFVSAIALVLTAEATSYVAITAKAKDKLRFENAVGRSQGDIQDRLNTYITLLRGGSGLFAANDSVSKAQFGAFVNHFNLRPAILIMTNHCSIPEKTSTVRTSERPKRARTVETVWVV